MCVCLCVTVTERERWGEIEMERRGMKEEGEK